MAWHGMAVFDMACARLWPGMEWHWHPCHAVCKTGCGHARCPCYARLSACLKHGMAWHGMAWQCLACLKHGMAPPCMARHGMAWHGTAMLALRSWLPTRPGNCIYITPFPMPRSPSPSCLCATFAAPFGETLKSCWKSTAVGPLELAWATAAASPARQRWSRLRWHGSIQRRSSSNSQPQCSCSWERSSSAAVHFCTSHTSVLLDTHYKLAIVMVPHGRVL